MGKRLIIKTPGTNKIDTMRAIRQVTGRDLIVGKEILDAVIVYGSCEIDFDPALSIDAAFNMMKTTGAHIEIVDDNSATAPDPLALTDAEHAVIDAARDYSTISDCSYIPTENAAFFSIREKLRLRLESAINALARAREPVEV